MNARNNIGMRDKLKYNNSDDGEQERGIIHDVHEGGGQERSTEKSDEKSFGANMSRARFEGSFDTCTR